mmetsp:Transcript_23252/g.45290  ORF Transcript_23252/g.45290 Transcript_23252/m.45290 type:complete len:933 (+) Transcript_23252:30-2828(+)
MQVMSLLLIGAGGASALAAAGLTRTAAPMQAARAAVSMVELSSPDFTLAILGDLHLDPRDLEHSFEGREHFKEIMKDAPNPFLVSLGDLGESKDCTQTQQLFSGTTPCFEHVSEYLKRFELPFDVVGDHHDLEGIDKFATDSENLQSCFKYLGKETPQFCHQVAEKTLVVGVGFTVFRDAKCTSHKAFIDAPRLEWFEKTIANHPAEEGWKIFVFSLAPIIGSRLRVLQECHVVNGCRGLKHNDGVSSQKFIQIVRKSPSIKGWFFGHIHYETGVLTARSSRDGRRRSRLLRGNKVLSTSGPCTSAIGLASVQKARQWSIATRRVHARAGGLSPCTRAARSIVMISSDGDKGSEVSTLEERIQAIEGKISEVEKQIEECDANITIATSEQMRGYWIEEKKQLRRKEEQLREKETELLKQKTELLKRLPTPGALQMSGPALSAQVQLFMQIACKPEGNKSDVGGHCFKGNESDVGGHRFESSGKQVGFPGDERNSFGNLLFIRDCYPPLLRRMLDSPRSSQARPASYFLTGTPGIGKTAFGLYFVCVLLAQKRSVLYQRAKMESSWLLCWEGDQAKAYEYISGSTEWRRLVNNFLDEGAWYIVDSIEPISCKYLPVLMISSPDPDISKDWVKQYSARELWMPMPSVEDVEVLKGFVSSDLTKADFDTRLQWAGTSARLVLSKKESLSVLKALQKKVEEALAQVSLDIFQSSLLLPEASRSLSHLIVHHDVVRPQAGEEWNFEEYTLRFASEFIETRVLEALVTRHCDQLWQMVNTPDAWRWMPTARGTFFEALVLRKLARNEPMQARRITETSATQKVAFNHTGEKRFEKLDDVRLSEGQLWVPTSQNFESIDALSQHGLFQITTARSGKSIKHKGLATAAGHWKSAMGDATLRLFFVVPWEMSEVYQKTLPITPSGMPQVLHEQYVAWFEER